MLIAIQSDGSIQMIYSDSMREILDEGQGSIRRASHVEPTIDNTWEADLNPIGHDVILGPFNNRQEALAAEVEYLNENIISK